MNCAAPGDRVCKCCEAGEPCAYVLQLDARQEAQLSRVLELVGENPERSQQIGTNGVSRATSTRDVEPMTNLECDQCGRVESMFTYLIEFLRSNHVRIPCPVCATNRRAA